MFFAPGEGLLLMIELKFIENKQAPLPVQTTHWTLAGESDCAKARESIFASAKLFLPGERAPVATIPTNLKHLVS